MEKSKDLSYSEIKNELDEIQTKLNLHDDRFSFNFERNDFNFTLALSSLQDSDFIECLALCKRHIENWRIHTFEKGFLSLQALNENLFSTENILHNVKVRLSGLYGEKSLEITKRGNPNQAEISLIKSLTSHFSKELNPVDPLERLAQAGCNVYRPEDVLVSFEQFAGYESTLDEVKETIIMPLDNADVFDKITKATRENFESNRPRAVLFSGPPGVGKTTMAKIIARESNLPLIYVPLESIMSSYYGESSKRLALIFDIAATSNLKGLIIFLDEIDSLAPSRNDKIFEATRRLLSVLLRKIDGLESQENTLTIGATNRKDDLDAALLSRFDTIISFPNPSVDDIVAILKLYAKHLSKKDVLTIAERLQGYSPRSIIDVCKKAERMMARFLIQNNSTKITLPGAKFYLKAVASE